MDDLISRQAAIGAVDAIGHIATMPDGDKCIRRSAVKYTLSMLPSAQPEPHYDEWCTGCKEYDQKRNNCPRWNKVIRQTLKDIEPKEGHWIQYDKRFPWRFHYKCSECGNYLDFSGVNGGRGKANYCPNCGAKMKGRTDGKTT